MPKIKASVRVRGVSLREMIADARSQVEDFDGSAKWQIDDIDMSPSENVALDNGMARLWGASISFTSTFEEGS